MKLFTSAWRELRDALRIGVRNIYGSTTAPPGLWLDLHRTLVSLGATPILGERCLWAWFSKIEVRETGHPRLLGVMGY